MSTFFDPATIRRLAATGDAFYRGAAWILDQQDAAKVKTSADHLREYERPVAEAAVRVERDVAAFLYQPAVQESLKKLVTPNAADLGAPRIG